ncbi:F0F1 ATP synthase assembly protein [Martelella alba]|uniref:ATP synthase protein I n=1 Tax=Martelella alba TaxID=2590451 RepID=A0A506UDJ0_9HYPH|nr:AtpZ/AtpI family protein [Martelella alba]TPW31014.1 F0F1 ATP synthase assembly protein [Martelella alba]
MPRNEDEESLEKRRFQLEKQVEALRKQRGNGDEPEAPAKVSDRKQMSQGLKLSSEFISAVFVGFMIGYLLDRFAGTGPWGMVIFILLGFVAGVLNVLRAIGVVRQPEDRLDGDDK